MSAIQNRLLRGRVDAERVWRLIAAGACVAGVVLLAAFAGLGYGLRGLGGAPAAAVRTLDAVVRSPAGPGPPPLPAGWRHSSANAVIFYGGYFCGRGEGGRRVRLVLTERDLDTLTQGSKHVVGPVTSKARTGGIC